MFVEILSKLISLTYHQNLYEDSWNIAAQDGINIKQIALFFLG